MGTKKENYGLELGEIAYSKEFPDMLADETVLTILWALVGGEPVSFAVIEDMAGDRLERGASVDSFPHPHTFTVYGAFHGKVEPWQVQLADLEAKKQFSFTAKSLAKAELVLFDKVQEICDVIEAGGSKNASMTAKVRKWKALTNIELLFKEGSTFNSCQVKEDEYEGDLVLTKKSKRRKGKATGFALLAAQ